MAHKPEDEAAVAELEAYLDVITKDMMRYNFDSYAKRLDISEAILGIIRKHDKPPKRMMFNHRQTSVEEVIRLADIGLKVERLVNKT